MPTQQDSSSPQRSATRYPLALKVVLSEGHGVTRDISATGVYFSCDGAFEPNSKIDFVVQFEAAPGDAPMQLRCQGTVVRVEEADGRTGVAARISSHVMEAVG